MHLKLLRQMTQQKPEEAPPPSPGRNAGSLRTLDPRLIASPQTEAPSSPTETRSTAGSVSGSKDPSPRSPIQYDAKRASSSHSSECRDDPKQTLTSTTTPVTPKCQVSTPHLSASLSGTWQRPVSPSMSRSRDSSPRSPRLHTDSLAASSSGSWQKSVDPPLASAPLPDDPRITRSSSVSSRSDSHSELFVAPRKGSFPIYTVIPPDSTSDSRPASASSAPDLSPSPDSTTSPRRGTFQVYTANKQ